jgi:uncharacterized protein YxeA
MQNNDKSPMATVLSVLVVILIAIAAFFFFTRDDAEDTDNTEDTEETTNTTDTTTDTTDTTETEIPETTTINLAAQNESGQNGTAFLEEVGSQVRVTLTLTNPSTTAEPAHIHTGNCPTPGAVVFPLTDVVNGTSVTMIDTNFNELVNMGDLAINVHKSSAESSVYFACGDLEF